MTGDRTMRCGDIGDDQPDSCRVSRCVVCMIGWDDWGDSYELTVDDLAEPVGGAE